MAADDITFIDTPAGLRDLCARLAGLEWVALDTEFHREKTYYPKLCLIQVATADHVACIDPLALGDLAPLMSALEAPGLMKVFHAARQDLEVFHQRFGRIPTPVFDTQLAAPLLGHPEQMGYAALVAAELGEHLGKGHARADWTRRPLPPKQLRYAADDVRYLARLYPRLRDALAARGRLAWLEEDFSALADPAQYINPPADAWRRIRGIDRLRGPERSVLQALAEWREATAQGEDRPRNWVIKDETLLDLARQNPVTAQDLAHVRGLSEGTRRRHGEHLLKLMAQARERPPRPLDGAGRPVRLEPAQEALADLLSATVRLVSAEQAINSGVLVSRRDLERLARGVPVREVLQGWRYALAGPTLQSLLAGHTRMGVHEGRATLSDKGD
ncbi:MAG TPA: ribonuclease D [Gammaproteobacteria bacterium]|nr:ribonuclease D [Gammaproteobacteria bacterium]